MSQTTVLNGIPVNSLYPDRYGVGKSKIYATLKELGITPHRDRKTACLTLEQLLRLDRHMAGDSSSKSTEVAETEPGSGIVPVELSTLPPVLQLLISAIANQISPPTPDPLLPQRQLQEIADRGWLVSTSQLAAILGVRPTDGMVRYGFVCDRAGRSGRESSFKVVKASTVFDY